MIPIEQLDALATEAEVRSEREVQRLSSLLAAGPLIALNDLKPRAQCFLAQRATLLRLAHTRAGRGALPELLSVWRRTLRIRVATLGTVAHVQEHDLAYLSALASCLNAIDGSGDDEQF